MYRGAQTNEVHQLIVSGGKEGTVTDHYQAHLKGGGQLVGRATAAPSGEQNQ